MLAAANVQLRGVALVNPAARSAWRMVLVDREQPSAAARSRACRIRTGATGRSAHSASRTARSVAESSLTSTPARRASRRPPSTAARAARSSHFSQFSHLSHGVSENLSRSAPTWRGGRAHRYPPRQLPSSTSGRSQSQSPQRPWRRCTAHAQGTSTPRSAASCLWQSPVAAVAVLGSQPSPPLMSEPLRDLRRGHRALCRRTPAARHRCGRQAPARRTRDDGIVRAVEVAAAGYLVSSDPRWACLGRRQARAAMCRNPRRRAPPGAAARARSRR
jgi:hypothetical protein